MLSDCQSLTAASESCKTNTAKANVYSQQSLPLTPLPCSVVWAIFSESVRLSCILTPTLFSNFQPSNFYLLFKSVYMSVFKEHFLVCARDWIPAVESFLIHICNCPRDSFTAMNFIRIILVSCSKIGSVTSFYILGKYFALKSFEITGN